MRRTSVPVWLVALTACATAPQVETQAPPPSEDVCTVEVANQTEYVLPVRVSGTSRKLGELKPHESLTFEEPCEHGSVAVYADVRVSLLSPLHRFRGSAALVRGEQARIVLRW